MAQGTKAKPASKAQTEETEEIIDAVVEPQFDTVPSLQVGHTYAFRYRGAVKRAEVLEEGNGAVVVKADGSENNEVVWISEVEDLIEV